VLTQLSIEDNAGLKARASALDDIAPSNQDKDTDNLSKGVAAMSIDDEAYDAYDGKSVLSKFSVKTSRSCRASTSFNAQRIPVSSTSLRLPYRVHTWRDPQLRGRTSIIIHMLSGKTALNHALGLLKDNSTLVLGHLYTEYMMDKQKAIFEPILCKFNVENDPTGAGCEKVSAVLENHPRTIVFDRDVERMLRKQSGGQLIFKEEMHIKLPGPHDAAYVSFEEDNLFYGCYYAKDPVDKAKYLRIELKEKTKDESDHLLPGLESDVMSIRVIQPDQGRPVAVGGFNKPPEHIAFRSSSSTIHEGDDDDDDDDDDDIDDDLEDVWEQKSFKSSKSVSNFSFGTHASGKKKKKLKISTGHNVTPASMKSSSSKKSSSHMLPYTGRLTKTPTKTPTKSPMKTPLMTPQSRSSMKTPQSQRSHGSKKRNAMVSLQQAAAQLQDHEKKKD